MQNNAIPTVETLAKALDALPEHIIQSESDDEALQHLAALPALEYDRLRIITAKKLNVRATTLDAMVNAKRQVGGNAADNGGEAMFAMVEPWPSPVDGAALLADIADTVGRFIVFQNNESLYAAALWVAFTWIIEQVQVAPLAVITAPEKRCGKTMLLSVFTYLVRNPLPTSNITPAALFRCIEAFAPTLLIDEADAAGFDNNEDMRGLLNAGHTRPTAFVMRVVGDDHEPRRFNIFGAKVVCGIGKRAETIMDRAIVFDLRRALPGEKRERLRHAEDGLWLPLQQRLCRWAMDIADRISACRPSLPEALNDRAQDNWEPLFIVAELAGGDWPRLAKITALKLAGIERDAPSISAELLADIREVFESKRADRIHTADLLAGLCDDEEKPWATWNHGKPFNARQLKNRLEGFGINPRQLKIVGINRNGYELNDFADAFERYLGSTPDLSSTTLLSFKDGDLLPFYNSTQNNEVEDKTCKKHVKDGSCRVVEDKTPILGDDDDVEVF